ncbi:hypothetical protein JCM10207_004314 [Rhodosporidiobolus poonsookiae]
MSMLRTLSTRAPTLAHPRASASLPSSLVLRQLSSSSRSPSLASALARNALATPPTPLPPLLAHWASTRTPLVPFFSSSYSTTSAQPPSPSQHSSSQSTPPPPEQDDTKAPLTQRIKILFRKHGWTALVVYLVLSALDFGLCFLLIYAVGADKVRAAEDWVLDNLGWRRKDGDDDHPGRIRQAVQGWKNRHGHGEAKTVGTDQKALVGGGEAHAPVEAAVASVKQDDKGYSALATTAVLAYAIHKTALLPFRVGVTVAITPKVVRTLQSWGWKVGMAGAATAPAAAAATSGAGAAGGAGAAAAGSQAAP